MINPKNYTKISKILFLFSLAITLNFVGCKPKDSDIKAAVEQSFSSVIDVTNPGVEVKDGIATLTGVCKSDSVKANFEKSVAAIKGVKSVVNNCTVTPPPAPVMPSAVVSAVDSVLIKRVTDATKDFPSVTGKVADGVITLTGEIKKASLPKLMMTLNSLKPKKVENKLTIK